MNIYQSGKKLFLSREEFRIIGGPSKFDLVMAVARGEKISIHFEDLEDILQGYCYSLEQSPVDNLAIHYKNNNRDNSATTGIKNEEIWKIKLALFLSSGDPFNNLEHFEGLYDSIKRIGVMKKLLIYKEKLKEEESTKVEENKKLVAYDDESYTQEELRNEIAEDAFGNIN